MLKDKIREVYASFPDRRFTVAEIHKIVSPGRDCTCEAVIAAVNILVESRYLARQQDHSSNRKRFLYYLQSGEFGDLSLFNWCQNNFE